MRLRSTDCAFTSGADTAGFWVSRRRVPNSDAGLGNIFSKEGWECGCGDDLDDEATAPCPPKLKLCGSLLACAIESTCVSVYRAEFVDGGFADGA